MTKLCKLSDRLEAILSMLDPGCRLCDVGCDHGYVGIAALQRRIAVFSLLMDVNPGPLERAKEHVKEAGLLQDEVMLRLSDGLRAYRPGEADTLIIAGMGGMLIRRILSEDPDKTRSFRRMILSPQSDLPEFRAFLRESGLRINDETMIFEDGKFYVVMRVSPADEKDVMLTEALAAADRKAVMSTELADRFGPSLLEKKDPVLQQFLLRKREKCDIILCKLEAEPDSPSVRQAAEEHRHQLELTEQALAFYEPK